MLLLSTPLVHQLQEWMMYCGPAQKVKQRQQHHHE
jgi:hypothetical protein